jgi:hypothetical protein
MLRPGRNNRFRFSGYLIKYFLMALCATLILAIILSTFVSPAFATQFLSVLSPVFYKTFMMITSFTFIAVILESF